jgi:hypothetical protein
MTDYMKPHDCDNCGDSVVRRRPSKTGRHFCKRPQCQAAKQRFYRQRAKLDITPPEVAIENTKLALFAAIVQEKFFIGGCPECGQAPAYDGWVHPTPGWGRVCTGTGIGGDVPELSAYYKLLWPTGCPF